MSQNCKQIYGQNIFRVDSSNVHYEQIRFTSYHADVFVWLALGQILYPLEVVVAVVELIITTYRQKMPQIQLSVLTITQPAGKWYGPHLMCLKEYRSCQAEQVVHLFFSVFYMLISNCTRIHLQTQIKLFIQFSGEILWSKSHQWMSRLLDSYSVVVIVSRLIDFMIALKSKIFSNRFQGKTSRRRLIINYKIHVSPKRNRIQTIKMISDSRTWESFKTSLWIFLGNDILPDNCHRSSFDIRKAQFSIANILQRCWIDGLMFTGWCGVI